MTVIITIATCASVLPVKTVVCCRFSESIESDPIDVVRSLETSWPAAQRLERPKGNHTLRQMERAAAALGKRLVIELR